MRMLGARSRWISVTAAVALSTAVGCGARAGDPGDDTGDDVSDVDGPVGGTDAASVIDAASPIDARPCVEGDAQAVDPTTGTCFTAHIQTRVPWADARAACQAMGADLAIITSAADNAFLTTLLGANEAFVGGNDLALEGTFRWVDNSLLTYSNWRQNETTPDEPNNGNGNYQEDCIVLQGQLGGVWDDRPCAPGEVAAPAGTHFYLCAR